MDYYVGKDKLLLLKAWFYQIPLLEQLSLALTSGMDHLE